MFENNFRFNKTEIINDGHHYTGQAPLQEYYHLH